MSLLAELKRRNVFRMAILYGVSGWLLLQVGDVLFGLLGVPDWSLRLLLGILLLGFPVALIFSWVYELTPEGLKREREVDRSQSIAGTTAKKLDLAVIGLLVLGLAVFLADRGGWLPDGASTAPATQLTSSSSAPSPETAGLTEPVVEAPENSSIAVLPFVNMSSDPEQEYFSDGLAESLLHLLAQINDLRVAARTSSFHFKNHTGDISEVGRQLNVAHVLEGSVRRAGDTLRVTAQLIKVDDGYHLWSGTYDREMDDIFAIQDDIANRVVEALKTTLLGDAQSSAELGSVSTTLDTDNLAAYEAFLRGREQLFIGSHVSLPLAEAFLQQALELDPDYVLAMISLGEAYKSMENTGLITRAEAQPRLERIGEQVLQLQPESAAGLAVLAMARWYQDRTDLDATERDFRKAYERDPRDPFVALTYGEYLSRTGRRDQAIPVLNEALERDPMSPELHVRLALLHRVQDPEKALAHAARASALEPGNPNALGIEGQIFARRGEFVRAIDVTERTRALDPDDFELPSDIAMYLLAFGETEAARQYIDIAQAMTPDGTLPIMAEALLLHRQGRNQAAASMVRDAIEAGIEPRRWGWLVALIILHSQALASGDAGWYLDPIRDWLNVDFSESALAHGGELLPRLLAAVLYQATGQDSQAQPLIQQAIEFAARNPDENDQIEIALATGESEQLLDGLTARLDSGRLSSLDWMFLNQTAMRNLLGDSPRYQALLDRVAANEREQARLWAQYQDSRE